MPTLRSFLRAYLGIDLILQRDSGLAARLAHIERQQTDLLRQLGTTNHAVARILGRIDPFPYGNMQDTHMPNPKPTQGPNQ